MRNPLTVTKNTSKLFITRTLVGLLIAVSALVNEALAVENNDTPTGLIEDLRQQSAIVTTFDASNQNGPDCFGMIEVNDSILANIYTTEYGCELHKLDDQNGSQLLADINPGPEGYTHVRYPWIRDDFGLFPSLAGWYYFEADDGTHGNELWRTDGTIVEPVGSGDEWLEDSAVELSRSILNGRLYLSVRLKEYQVEVGEYHMFSTDGLSMRIEPDLLPDATSRTEIVGTFQDKLLLWGEEEQHGREPWIFDGNAYQSLGDLNEGPDSSLSQRTNFVTFNDYWLFDAERFDSLDNELPAVTKTDGVNIEETTHTGYWTPGNDLLLTRSIIRSTNATYVIKILDGSLITPPPEQQIRVMRINDVTSAEYDVGTRFGMYDRPSAAVLGEDALVLMANTLFLLGETSAEEIELTIPSEWQNSDFEFVGSSLYFDHTYVKETDEEGNSRVWAWSYTEAGLLMANETNLVTSADHFRHIGNDIFFYGEDEINGRALRKISNEVIKPIPRLGAVTGTWFDPATSGQGFVLHPVDDDRTVFSFYGFENDGKPLWLTGVSNEPLETWYPTELTMYTNSGGSFGSFTPDQISEEEWGTLKITFNTCSKAIAELDGISGQQTMHMGRLARLEGMECDQKIPPKPETAGITGSWYDPTTSGQGLVLHSINDEQMIISYYGYKNNSERLWLIGFYSGHVVHGEPLVMDMVFTTGGKFGGFSPDDITETRWGALTINFDDCNNAVATLNGIDGQQTMHLVKLAGLQGSELDCH